MNLFTSTAQYRASSLLLLVPTHLAALAAASTDECHAAFKALVVVAYIGVALVALWHARGDWASPFPVCIAFWIVNAFMLTRAQHACYDVPVDVRSLLVQHPRTADVLGVYIPKLVNIVRRVRGDPASPAADALPQVGCIVWVWHMWPVLEILYDVDLPTRRARNIRRAKGGV